MEALRGEVAAMKALRASNEVSAVQFQKTGALLQAAEAENASAAAKLKLLQAGTRRKKSPRPKPASPPRRPSGPPRSSTSSGARSPVRSTEPSRN